MYFYYHMLHAICGPIKLCFLIVFDMISWFVVQWDMRPTGFNTIKWTNIDVFLDQTCYRLANGTNKNTEIQLSSKQQSLQSSSNR